MRWHTQVIEQATNFFLDGLEHRPPRLREGFGAGHHLFVGGFGFCLGFGQFIVQVSTLLTLVSRSVPNGNECGYIAGLVLGRSW